VSRLTDRGRITAWTEPLDLIEGQIRPCRNYKIIVINALAVIELDPLLRGVKPFRADGGEADLLAGEDRRQMNLDCFGLPPPDGDPRV